jgi:prepilin-type N-terminal cleavage/methylation domain-containing protein
MLKKHFSLQRGFTLVELLVVIAIIGVLSTLLLLQLTVARAKARDAKRVADINQVRSAMELYYDDIGAYPDQATGIDALLTDYLTKLPNDPSRPGCDGLVDYDTDGCYRYAWSPAANPQGFHLWAELEREAKSALGNDLDGDSTVAGWSGEQVDGATETCASPNAPHNECVYDTGTGL